jgi:hypothetical protein
MAAKLSFQYRSLAGPTFNVSPALVPDIEALIDKVRGEISTNSAAGRFIGYLSVPVSGKSGGDFQTNTDMAAQVTQRVQRQFGNKLWLLNPAAYNLPKAATGGDYMAVWADVLAGIDGSGSDFDMAYFVGPSDVWRYFGAEAEAKLDVIDKWLAEKAKVSPSYRAIYDDASLRQKFIRYYGLRGSTIFSKGAHDEWNIVLGLNAKRAIGEYIAVYFDGKPIEPGDYQVSVAAGYETLLH